MMWSVGRLRTWLYTVWGLLPSKGKEVLVFLGAPKVTVGVSAVIPDSQGRILLVHHTYRYPAWGFPGGLVRRDELATAGLRRELREELGLTATIGALLHADHEPRRHLLSLHYRVSVTGTLCHGVEIDQHRYVTLEELPTLVGWPVPVWLREAAFSDIGSSSRAG